MTQFFADADNGIDTADGLTIARSGTASITSSSVANPSNILCVAHGMVSTESTTIAGHSSSTPDINGDHIITDVFPKVMLRYCAKAGLKEFCKRTLYKNGAVCFDDDYIDRIFREEGLS